MTDAPLRRDGVPLDADTGRSDLSGPMSDFTDLSSLRWRTALWSAGAVLSLCLGGCALVPGETYVPPAQRVKDGSVHYNRPREQGKVGLKKLNPIWWLGNADEDYDPNWKPDKSHEWRKFTYAVRNPGHNFTHYVIGVSDRNFVRYGDDPGQIWNRRGRVNLATIHAGGLRLPFYSRQGRHFDQYIGWRESGNFGIAFRKAHAPDRRFPGEGGVGHSTLSTDRDGQGRLIARPLGERGVIR